MGLGLLNSSIHMILWFVTFSTLCFLVKQLKLVKSSSDWDKISFKYRHLSSSKAR